MQDNSGSREVLVLEDVMGGDVSRFRTDAPVHVIQDVIHEAQNIMDKDNGSSVPYFPDRIQAKGFKCEYVDDVIKLNEYLLENPNADNYSIQFDKQSIKKSEEVKTVNYKVKSARDRKAEVDAHFENLRNGIEDYLKSDSYKELLDNMSKFHEYSVNNSISIVLQKPDATLVGSYSHWKKLNRQVNKGEKGIVILCPVKYRKMVEEVQKDEKGNVILDKDGYEVKNQKYVDCVNFKLGYVFDISQTSQMKGKPELILSPVEELKESVGKSYDDMVKAISSLSPVPVTFDSIQSGAKGYYDDLHEKIVIREGMSQSHTLKTMIHELAHARLHGSHWNSDYDKISFDYRECMEFPNLGEVDEDITLEDAIQKVGRSAHSSMVPGIVFRLHDGSDYDDMDYPLVIGDELQMDSLNLVEHFRESFEVQKAVEQLTPVFGNNVYLRSSKEIEAESIAYIVANQFGLDTSDYSFGYVGTWLKDEKQLMENLNVIKTTSQKMIEDIEMNLNKQILMKNEIGSKEDMAKMIDGFIREYDPFNYADNEQYSGFTFASILSDVNKGQTKHIQDCMKEIIDEDMETQMTEAATQVLECLKAFKEVFSDDGISDEIRISHSIR